MYLKGFLRPHVVRGSLLGSQEVPWGPLASPAGVPWAARGPLGFHGFTRGALGFLGVPWVPLGSLGWQKSPLASYGENYLIENSVKIKNSKSFRKIGNWLNGSKIEITR